MYTGRRSVIILLGMVYTDPVGVSLSTSTKKWSRRNDVGTIVKHNHVIVDEF
jgi:hypothetical protein